MIAFDRVVLVVGLLSCAAVANVAAAEVEDGAAAPCELADSPARAPSLAGKTPGDQSTTIELARDHETR